MNVDPLTAQNVQLARTWGPDPLTHVLRSRSNSIRLEVNGKHEGTLRVLEGDMAEMHAECVRALDPFQQY